jgi:nucleoside-diphosphate-sugar epimerase
MRIFLAGATGAIGRALLAMLIEHGHAVVAMTRRPELPRPLRAQGAEPVIADAFDRNGVIDAVQRARPDVVMHQLTDLRSGDRAANSALRIGGTRNLVDAARQAGVQRIVAQSIAFAYEPARSRPTSGSRWRRTVRGGEWARRADPRSRRA